MCSINTFSDKKTITLRFMVFRNNRAYSVRYFLLLYFRGMTFVLNSKFRNRADRNSLYAKVLAKYLENSVMTNIDPQYFVNNFRSHLNTIRGQITEEHKLEVHIALQQRVLEARDYWEMVVPANITPINYSPESSSSPESNPSPGEAKATTEDTDSTPPAPEPEQPENLPTSSDVFDFNKFMSDISATVLFLTDAQNRRITNRVTEEAWERFRVNVLRDVALACGIRRSTYGPWVKF